MKQEYLGRLFTTVTILSNLPLESSAKHHKKECYKGFLEYDSRIGVLNTLDNIRLTIFPEHQHWLYENAPLITSLPQMLPDWVDKRQPIKMTVKRDGRMGLIEFSQQYPKNLSNKPLWIFLKSTNGMEGGSKFVFKTMKEGRKEGLNLLYAPTNQQMENSQKKIDHIPYPLKACDHQLGKLTRQGTKSLTKDLSKQTFMNANQRQRLHPATPQYGSR